MIQKKKGGGDIPSTVWIGADLDEIFQEYLREYLEGIDVASYLRDADAELSEKSALLEGAKKERARLQRQIDAWIDLRVSGELSKEQFAEKYRPAEERVTQIDARLPALEAEIDVRGIQLMSGDAVIQEVRTLYDRWRDMDFGQRRAVVETVVQSIAVGKEDIEITLAYVPALSGNAKNSSHKDTDTSS